MRSKKRVAPEDHKPILAGETVLASRRAVAALAKTDPENVRRVCEQVACHVGTELALYDLDACLALLKTKRRGAA